MKNFGLTHIGYGNNKQRGERQHSNLRPLKSMASSKCLMTTRESTSRNSRESIVISENQPTNTYKFGKGKIRDGILEHKE